jgi:hypothetical protein
MCRRTTNLLDRHHLCGSLAMLRLKIFTIVVDSEFDTGMIPLLLWVDD